MWITDDLLLVTSVNGEDEFVLPIFVDLDRIFHVVVSCCVQCPPLCVFPTLCV